MHFILLAWLVGMVIMRSDQNRNKTTLLAITTAVISLVYQVLGLLGIAPGVSESEVTQAVGLVINILAMVGIVTDPTTQGVSDSDRALRYDKPQ